jgi:D-serine dehydratase
MPKPKRKAAKGIARAMLTEINATKLDDKVKGIPGGTGGLRLGDVGRRGWRLLNEDLPLPVAVLKTSALDNNGRWMARFLQATGAVIAPHGKTTMSPQLFDRQLRDGAWAITVATVGQLQTCRRFGISRLVLANQLVGRQGIRYVVGELARDPGFEFYVLVDSLDNVAQLAAEAKRAKLRRPINLLLEVGMTGGRSGCRTREAALTLARSIKASAPWVALCGVEAFEGLVRGTVEERETAVGRYLDFIVAVAADCRRENLFAGARVILSAGGSAFYDLAAERLAAAGIADALVVIRSGCYLTQDSMQYRQAFERIRSRSPSVAKIKGGLQTALELWAYVQSRPEPGRLILTIGKRDISYDLAMPAPFCWHRPGTSGLPRPLSPEHKVVELNDQHAHVVMPTDSPLKVGDMVGLGISHPCTTFDKWQVMFLVDDAYKVTGAIRTFF